jgi:hypothetical protein
MTPETKPTFDFLPLSLRLETLGGVATPLVLRGTPLPAKRSEAFSTAADNQVTVAVELLMGESPLAKGNTRLGKLELKGIPAVGRGEPQVKVEFSVEKTCSVTARATLQGSPLSAEQTFDPPLLSVDFISKALSQAESNQAENESELLRIEATNRAKGLIAKAESQLGQGPNTKLSEAVAALGLALASENSRSIREKSDDLERLVALPSDLFSGFDFSDLFGPPKAGVNRKYGVPSAPRPAAKSEQRLTPQAHQPVLGKIFGGTTFTLDPQLSFVLMPFDTKLQPVYDDHIKPTVMRSGLRCERADDIRGASLITWEIWERINRARFLIADLTDRNANVFYELGLAHALSKDVILITPTMDFVPFDLKTVRCIVYEFNPRGMQKFEKTLGETITALMKSA